MDAMGPPISFSTVEFGKLWESRNGSMFFCYTIFVSSTDSDGLHSHCFCLDSCVGNDSVEGHDQRIYDNR